MKKLQDKLTGEEISKAMKHLIKTKWWKLLEEYLQEKIKTSATDILLWWTVVWWKRKELTPAWEDILRRQILNIRRLLELPHSKIILEEESDPEDKITQPVAEDVMADVLTDFN